MNSFFGDVALGFEVIGDVEFFGGGDDNGKDLDRAVLAVGAKALGTEVCKRELIEISV